MTRSPPAINDSLFASATVLPASSAASVGSKPREPTRAFNTTSAPTYVAGSRTASSPVEKYDPEGGSASAATGRAGANSSTCSASSSAFRPATSATTSNWSRCFRMTSSAWVPMLPVEPRIAIRFTPTSCQRRRPCAGSENSDADEPIGGRCHQKERIDTVEHPSVARQDRPHVLHTEIALDQGLRKVAERGDHRSNGSKRQRGADGERLDMRPHSERQHEHEKGRARSSLPRLLRTHGRRHRVLAEERACGIGADVA